MASLEELRIQLDDIDEQIIRLYEKRMEACEEVADYKAKTGKKVYDKTRELQKLAAAQGQLANKSYETGVRELFQLLMSVSRKLQYQKLTQQGASGRLAFIGMSQLKTHDARIVFQGAEGAYSQEALRAYFGEQANCFHVPKWRDAMEAIEDGTADYAVLPIENSTAGAVSAVYDLLVEFENYIVAEVVIPISHVLCGLPDSSIDGLRRIYSHPQGLMQCERFFSEHGNIEQISVANTAQAAEKVWDEHDLTQGAICSAYAAKRNGLAVLKEQVNDAKNNSTRFIIVTNQKVFLEDAKKISICLEVPHESGSLYQILSHFIYNNLNMTKIESRPIEERPWEYRFFIDFEGNLADSAVKNAIRGLREEARSLKILGNY